MPFAEAWTALQIIEGGPAYSNHPDDSGKSTRFGVTEAVARRHGYQGSMKALPLEVAMAIGKAAFWDVLRLDAVEAISKRTAYELFEFGYHAGPRRPAISLQRQLNALNRQQALYVDIDVDGDIGGQTLDALARYLAHRKAEGELVLLRGLNALQASYYLALVEGRQKDESFYYGWLLRRVEI